MPIPAVGDDSNLYLAQREAIEQAIAYVCRRHRLSHDDAQEFASVARLHLLENDCAALRAFANRSSLQTYLASVISNRFHDWRNARWGKWRPSAQARRTGPAGIELERLIVRDGRPFEQACAIVREHFGVTETDDELRKLVDSFPSRPGREFVEVEALEELPSRSDFADAGIHAREAALAANRFADHIAAALRTFGDEDRLLLRWRFDDGQSIADIARALRLDAKPLYRRLASLLVRLREQLQDAGLSAEHAALVLQHGGFDHTSATESGETPMRVRLFEQQGCFPTGRSGSR